MVWTVFLCFRENRCRSLLRASWNRFCQSSFRTDNFPLHLFHLIDAYRDGIRSEQYSDRPGWYLWDHKNDFFEVVVALCRSSIIRCCEFGKGVLQSRMRMWITKRRAGDAAGAVCANKGGCNCDSVTDLLWNFLHSHSWLDAPVSEAMVATTSCSSSSGSRKLWPIDKRATSEHCQNNKWAC